MIEIWLGSEKWKKRSEIFNWCESIYGEYDRTKWQFFSDYVESDRPNRKSIVLCFQNPTDADLFILKWK